MLADVEDMSRYLTYCREKPTRILSSLKFSPFNFFSDQSRNSPVRCRKTVVKRRWVTYDLLRTAMF